MTIADDKARAENTDAKIPPSRQSRQVVQRGNHRSIPLLYGSQPHFYWSGRSRRSDASSASSTSKVRLGLLKNPRVTR